MGAGAKATPPPSSSSAGDDGAGMPWLVVILLAAPLVFAGGLLLGHRRNRDKAEPAVTVTEPPAPKRFQWRDYPEPARPAPPPPPVPGSRAPGFEVGLEEARSAGPARTKQREPH
jgi:hypothetical protein